VQGTILGTVGFAFLLYTVVSMIQKIEESLNFVWHVERPRSLARRVSEYLVVMLIGPAIAVFAMVLLARVEASDVLARLSGLASGDTGTLGTPHFTPYVMVVALFAFVYVYMPNTRVRIGPALVGALFAGLLWAAVGALFTRIVVYSAKTAAVYAGFAVVLLFLVWVYISWLILLLGAQLSFYVQHPEHLRSGHAEVPLTGALRERVALAVMCLVGERFLAGARAGRSPASPNGWTYRARCSTRSCPRCRRTGWCSTSRTTPWRPPVTSGPSRSTRSSTRCGTKPRTRAGRPRAPCRRPTSRRASPTRPCAQASAAARCATCCNPGRRGCGAGSGAGHGHLLDEDRSRADAARASMSVPTSTMPRYMSRRLPAMVTSCTG